MATQTEKTFYIDAPPDDVVNTMRSTELIEDSEYSRDAKSVKIEASVNNDERHDYVVNTVVPAKTVTGIDKTKTEQNRSEVSWDLKARVGRWTWHGPQGRVAHVTGSYTVSPSGEGSRLVLNVEINIKIPLVGKAVEKKVLAGFEEQWPAYVDRIKKHLKKD